MNILAHRGFWNSEIENNSSRALRLALEAGFGFETDLRDYAGELVISHDIASAVSLRAEEVFCWLSDFSDRYCFAINIKADGLDDKLAQSLAQYRLKNYFAFDMSVPQMLRYRERGIVFFTRQSEIEPEPILYEDAAGVWIDGFWNNEWITENLLYKHVKNKKSVCLVSPELHKRSYLDFWEQISKFDIDFEKVFLCTDYPQQAAEFFSLK